MVNNGHLCVISQNIYLELTFAIWDRGVVKVFN
jgi:hypothetical protein